MKKLIRRILKTLLFTSVALILMLAGGAAWLLTSNANFLKPYITEQLAKQHIYTAFNGDLRWSVYPVAGITTEQVVLYATEDQRQGVLASLDRLDLQLDLIRLIKTRELVINAVELRKPQLNFTLNAHGTSNWQPVLNSLTEQQPADKTPAPTSANTSAATLEIAKINIDGLQVHYRDEASNTELHIDDTHLRMLNVNLQGNPIALTLESDITAVPYPSTRLSLSASVQQRAENRVQVSDLTLSVDAGEGATATLTGQFDVATVPTLKVASTLSLEPMNPRKWLDRLSIALPPMASAGALTQVEGELEISLDDNLVTVNTLSVDFDETHLSGNARVQLDSLPLPAINANLQLGQLNLDHYLPPATDSPAPEEPAAAEETSDTPLDLSSLDDLKVSLNISLKTLQVIKQKAHDIRSRIQIGNGRLAAQLDNVAIYQGKIQGTAMLSNAKPGAQLTAHIEGAGLQAGEALVSLELYDQLHGPVSFAVDANGQGQTVSQLQAGILARLHAQSSSLRFDAVNLEQTYCEAIARLEQRKVEREWPAFTEITGFDADLIYTTKGIAISALKARVQGIDTDATGIFEPASGDFNIPLNLAFSDFTAAQKGCLLLNAKWRSQRIPLICKGTLDKIDAGICGPDYKRLSDKLETKFKDESKKASDKVEQRYQEKREEAKDKVDEGARKLLDKLVGEDKSEEVGNKLEDRLKNLLNRK